MKPNEWTQAVIGAAMEVHRALGPGLLESAYEECLAREFELSDIPFERQVPLPSGQSHENYFCRNPAFWPLKALIMK